MAVGAGMPFSVDDVWVTPGDPEAFTQAAAVCRCVAGRWPVAAAVADELDAAAAALRHGQCLLDAVLERLDVPMSWNGRLTFYPHDEADLFAVEDALDAAAVIHGHVRRALFRHRAAVERALETTRGEAGASPLA